MLDYIATVELLDCLLALRRIERPLHERLFLTPRCLVCGVTRVDADEVSY